ncbi:unnamed protein product [Taenia asiatica]|uniref:Mediator of RNA polymerase II transcription subunit 21 n=1 Tax=Taenia asiatica TaxID=60517 RepID=A0A0R3WB46_TAEAS|nr:unnamed protein product [Taenia asiatica]
MDVLASLTSLKDFANDIKRSLENLAEVSDKLLHTASNIQSLFESNEKQSSEAESESPSFLDEAEVRTDSMDNLLEAVKLLQDEIQRLPELIEAAISKEKIDELTSFVIEDLPELQC